MVIVEENEEYSSIIGSSSAPYLNGLAGTYTSATSWFAVQKNSIHDYLDLVSGSDWGIGGSNQGPFPGPTLVDELTTRQIGWKAYMEDAPSACYTKGDVAGYMKGHNPLVYFSTILNDSSKCNSVVPFAGNFAGDLAAGTAPPFMFVVPNACNDMHGGNASFTCTSTNSVSLGDTWLKNNLPTVLHSSWYTSGGVVIITWDEGSSKKGFNGGNGGHVATLVIAANATAPYTAGGDHFGTLRAIEEAYGVGLLGASADAGNGDLTGAF